MGGSGWRRCQRRSARILPSTGCASIGSQEAGASTSSDGMSPDRMACPPTGAQTRARCSGPSRPWSRAESGSTRPGVRLRRARRRLSSVCLHRRPRQPTLLFFENSRERPSKRRCPPTRRERRPCRSPAPLRGRSHRLSRPRRPPPSTAPRSDEVSDLSSSPLRRSCWCSRGGMTTSPSPHRRFFGAVSPGPSHRLPHPRRPPRRPR
jgi:hypothetical protein